MKRAALALLLALAGCGDHRLTTLRSSGAGGGPPGDCSTALFGFATIHGGTNGGLGGETVKVRTFAELAAELGRPERVIVQVEGVIANPAQAPVKPHKTIVGLGPASGLDGAGLNITDGDVIVRNLVIRNVRGADAITIQNATHVWIDHCDLSSDLTHGEDYYDGLVDIVHGSDDVTVSWTRFHDHFKTTLIGHDDDNADEDTGHLNVTYHHNWFERTKLYNPSIRFGTLHAYNNYYFNTGIGISARMGAHVVAETNFFDTVPSPLVTTESNTPGFIAEKGRNVYVNTGVNEITQSADVTLPYPYAADPADDVLELVTSCAGAGKIVP